MIENLKKYVMELGKVIVSENVPNMREAIQQLVNHAKDAEKQIEELNAEIATYEATLRAKEGVAKSYSEASKTKQETIHEMEGLAKQLDRYAIKLYKDRNQEPPVPLTEAYIVEVEKFLMDKAQQIRLFLLMRDLI